MRHPVQISMVVLISLVSSAALARMPKIPGIHSDSGASGDLGIAKAQPISTIALAAPVAIGTLKHRDDCAHIRQNPSRQASSLACLPQGTRVTLLQGAKAGKSGWLRDLAQNSWYQVGLSDQRSGWVIAACTNLAATRPRQTCTDLGSDIPRQLNENYPGWKESLPNCPCTEAEITRSPLFKSSPALIRRFERPYHPGAEKFYRSINPQKYPTVSGKTLLPGQQCTYAGGQLITHGPGAGTPDSFSPTKASVTALHRRWDVNPAKQLSWSEYHRTWTPNNGNRCPQYP